MVDLSMILVIVLVNPVIWYIYNNKYFSESVRKVAPIIGYLVMGIFLLFRMLVG